MTLSLRPYQVRTVAAARAQFRSGRRAVLVVSPTGSGKTVIAAAVVEAAIERGTRVLFGAHRVELLDQTVRKLASAGIVDVRIIRADRDDGRADAPVIVASVPTLAGKRWRDRLPEAGLVILDEAHHSVSDSWLGIATRYRSSRLLGFTATPIRGDNAGLGEAFDALVVGATVRELTELGHLVPLRTWAPAQVLDSGRLALTPLEAYRRHADGRRAIVFATRVQDAERHAAELNAGGVSAAAVHAQLSDEMRASVLARFVAGELRAVTNVDLWTEGTDIPAADACILACSPGHVGRLIQMAGRVLRPSPETGKKDAVLVDLCGSVLVHGTPEMDREYTLDGRGISRVDRLAIRQCPTCGGVFEAGPAVCTVCGAAMPAAARKALRSTGEGVEELGDLAGKRAAVLRRNLEAVAARRGYSAGWVERAVVAIGARRLQWR